MSSSDSPRATFESSSVNSNPDLVALEHEVLSFWEENNCFEKRVQKNEGGPRFKFLDGPITANNPMGVHHAWGRSLKDIFLRYKAMQGFECNWQNGFDCQGLWVEVEVEKELGFDSKKEIESYGLAEFSRACRDRVERFSQVQTNQSIRLGQWMDWENSYYTHHDDNIEGIWYFLKQCHENGWLTRKKLPMAWCTRCGTSLSEHEMKGSYAPRTHTAVFVKVPLEGQDRSLLVWTTTPWTLPANVAVAVNPEGDYVEVRLAEGNAEHLIVSTHALESICLPAYEEVAKFKGSDLAGLTYEPILTSVPAQEGVNHEVIPWGEVDAEEGSGIVHIAPGCGREDFDLGLEWQLDVLSPVDDNGQFLPDYGWLEGHAYDEANDLIIDRLSEDGRLLDTERYDHSYPVCWRCKQDVIFRAIDEWFIECDEVRPRLKSAARSVDWKPPHVEELMLDWLENMGDWCISRKRFWGLPLPFYPCNDCGYLTVIGSTAELEDLAVGDTTNLPELHRPWIDDIAIRCPECQETVTRVLEVGDCWLDAGIVPFTTLGYFEDRDHWERWFPAEWICEMREQVSLWFYSLLFMSVTLEDRASYEKVLAYERVVSEDGAPFSKTGYMIEFDEAVEEMGADVMRYLYASANVGRDVRFGYNLADDVRRQLLTFWNAHSFFATYAALDEPEIPGPEDPPPGVTDVDRWMLARTASFVETVTEAYEEFRSQNVIDAFESFLDDLSNWYIRTNRHRFWAQGTEKGDDGAYWTLYHAMKTATAAIAPVAPFISELVWQNMVRALEPGVPLSVHLDDWPSPPDAWRNSEMLADMEIAREAADLAKTLRQELGLRTRQPLKRLTIHTSDSSVWDAVDRFSDLLRRELNVKDITFAKTESSLYDERISLNQAEAGPLLRGEFDTVRAYVDELEGPELEDLIERVRTSGEVTLPPSETPIPASAFDIEHPPPEGLAVKGGESITVALDTELTDELRAEGLVRDFLRHVNVLRKELDLAVNDVIRVSVHSSSEQLTHILKEAKERIEREGRVTWEEDSKTVATSERTFQIGDGEVTVKVHGG